MLKLVGDSATVEFADANLGDRRLEKRLLSIVSRAAVSPSVSFPKMVPSVAEREAFYRFIENPRVDWRGIIAPHEDATAQRCREARLVRVAHDTSWFSFSGDREGLGPVAKSKKDGFAGHFSLSIDAEERRAPLGVLAVSAFVRPRSPLARTKVARAAKHRASRLKSREEKESARWMAGVRAAEKKVGSGAACIHVMDQEADNFAIFADLVAEERRFVIRGSVTRRLHRRGRRHVDDALNEVTAVAFRTVPLTARPWASAGHPARAERQAKLMIRARAIVLPRPTHAQHPQKALRLNVVHVFEPSPPAGEERIEWALYTTEPIDTPDAVIAIVDHYRARWRVEEYFKALKTGCALEKRQLTTYASLLRALVLLAPIAWHLLALRTIAHDAGETPASAMLDDVQVEVLRALSPASAIPRSAPTVRDVMRAIADIGGHVRQNGEPGWLVLGRGYEDFLKAEGVWRAALRTMRSDQS